VTEFFISKEYRVYAFGLAVGEVIIRPVQDRILLSLADTYRFAAYITLLYDRTPQDMLKQGERLRQLAALFKEPL